MVLTSPASIWINAWKTSWQTFFRILILQIAHLVPAFLVLLYYGHPELSCTFALTSKCLAMMASVEPSRGVHSSHSDPPIAAGAMGTLERPASVPFPPVWSPTKGGFVGLWWGRQMNVFDMFLFFILRTGHVHNFWHLIVHAKGCESEHKDDSVDSSSNSRLQNVWYHYLSCLSLTILYKTPLFSNRSGGPGVSSPDGSRPFGRSNPSALRLKSLPKAIVVMCWCVDVGGERWKGKGCVVLFYQSMSQSSWCSMFFEDFTLHKYLFTSV